MSLKELKNRAEKEFTQVIELDGVRAGTRA